MFQSDVRDFLLECKINNKGPQDVFPTLAKKAMLYYVPDIDKDFDNFKYIVKKDDSRLPLIFTDEDMLQKHFKPLNLNVKAQELSSREVLKKVLKNNYDGLILNISDETQYTLDRKLLQLLFREHLAIDFYMAGGAWCLSLSNQFLVLEISEKLYTIPIFYQEYEAIEFTKYLGQEFNIQFVNWKELLEFCVKSKIDNLVYQLNKPEMIFIRDPYLGWLYDSPFQDK